MVLHCPPVQIIIRADKGKNSSLTSQVAECSLTAHSENCSSNISSVKSGLQLCPSTIDTSNSKDLIKTCSALIWFGLIIYLLLHLCFLKDACWGLLARLSPTLCEVLNLNSRSFESHQILSSSDACNWDWKLDSAPSTHHTQVLTLRILVHFQVDRQVDTSIDRHALLQVEFNSARIICFFRVPLSVPKTKTTNLNIFWWGTRSDFHIDIKTIAMHCMACVCSYSPSFRRAMSFVWFEKLGWTTTLLTLMCFL